MSAIGNMTRDMFWLKPGLSATPFSTVNGRLTTDGIVQQDKGYLYVSGTASAADRRAGLMMAQPESIDTPYRVQCYVQATLRNFNFWLAIGYATTQTGTNDTIANEILIPMPSGSHIDEIFAIEGAEQPYPLYFALRTSQSATIYAAMSVQKLNEVHPQFQSTVS